MPQFPMIAVKSEMQAERALMVVELRKLSCLGLSTSFILLGIGIVGTRSETPIERGAYLVHGIVACGNCHTPKDHEGKPIADRELAGGGVVNTPVFRAVGPNITPDPETGIGNWTDDQIVNAIRNGKRPDGTIIGPPMPIAFYRNMSDSDVGAIVAYLRSVKPIKNRPEKSTYKIPLPTGYGPPVISVPDLPRTDKVPYGQYLAMALGHCMDCHTTRVNGRSDMSKVGAGGRQFETLSG